MEFSYSFFSHMFFLLRHLRLLYSLQTEDGLGLEAFWHQSSLCVGVCVQKGKRVGVRFKFAFEPKRWYLIGISHEYRFIRYGVRALFVCLHSVIVAMCFVLLCAVRAEGQTSGCALQVCVHRFIRYACGCAFVYIYIYIYTHSCVLAHVCA